MKCLAWSTVLRAGFYQVVIPIMGVLVFICTSSGPGHTASALTSSELTDSIPAICWEYFPPVCGLDRFDMQMVALPLYAAGELPLAGTSAEESYRLTLFSPFVYGDCIIRVDMQGVASRIRSLVYEEGSITRADSCEGEYRDLAVRTVRGQITADDSWTLGKSEREKVKEIVEVSDFWEMPVQMVPNDSATVFDDGIWVIEGSRSNGDYHVVITTDTRMTMPFQSLANLLLELGRQPRLRHVIDE